MSEWLGLLVTPVVGAVVGFGVWFLQNRIDRLRKAREDLHNDRRQVYADVLDPYIRLFAAAGDPAVQRKATAQITSYEYKKVAFEFSLIGSDRVVKAFNEMLQLFYAAEEQGEPPDAGSMLHYWGSFLLEIRRDVGDPKTKLEGRDMLRAMIKGVDKLQLKS